MEMSGKPVTSDEASAERTSWPWRLAWLLGAVADLHCVDNRIAEVGPELGIEGAAAGDEAQLCVGSRAVDGQRRKAILGIRSDSGDAEDRQRPVRSPHVHPV